jgi:virulence-associated protein VagC
MRPDVLRLPAGFNFDNPAVNITRQDFAGMTLFVDSDI